MVPGGSDETTAPDGASDGSPPELFNAPAPTGSRRWGPPLTPEGNAGVTIFDLRSHHCRYMISPTHYCGEPKQPGSSYCPEHHQRCIVPVRKSGA